MSIPDFEECKHLLRTTSTSMYVWSHSLCVMRIALNIYDLISPAKELNKDLLISGALLHDITKTRSLVNKEHHAETGEMVARELGCDEKICQIIGQHVRPERTEELTEIDVICYADKRAKWDYMVTMQERLEDLYERYGKNDLAARQRMKALHDDVYIPIEQAIGEIARENGKIKEYEEFIHETEEGKVVPFKGMNQEDLL
ncbi:HD domain-containing protein [Entamoeba marina]